MRISTRSRYGLRLMLYLAQNYQKGFLLLKDVAKNEEISEKYLSLIVIPLRRAGLLVSSRGVNGGYSLSKPPSKITVKEIVETLEGDLDLIECSKNEDICERSKLCAAHDLWKLLSNKIAEFLDSITLENLLEIQNEKRSRAIDYVI